MSLAKRIFELQQADLSIQSLRKKLGEINAGIENNDSYEHAKEALAQAKDAQRGVEKKYRELDAEADELRSAIKSINNKLYGGKINNPKELQGYEQEAGIIKSNLAKRDDVLLEIMEQIEAGKVTIKNLEEEYSKAENAWDGQKDELRQQSRGVTEELAAVEKKREEIFSSTDKSTLSMYEGIRSRKGQAVVRVEQGRCLGCRMTLSISELQRVRGNEIVTCSNCGRILYMS